MRSFVGIFCLIEAIHVMEKHAGVACVLLIVGAGLLAVTANPERRS